MYKAYKLYPKHKPGQYQTRMSVYGIKFNTDKWYEGQIFILYSDTTAENETDRPCLLLSSVWPDIINLGTVLHE